MCETELGHTWEDTSQQACGRRKKKKTAGIGISLQPQFYQQELVCLSVNFHPNAEAALTSTFRRHRQPGERRPACESQRRECRSGHWCTLADPQLPVKEVINK